MTKIGEGKQPPELPNVRQYQQQVELSSTKFINALESYKVADNSDERSRLRSIMDQQMQLIRAAIQEIKRAGAYKQEVKVEHDYQQYMENQSPESLSALEQDLEILRDYTQGEGRQ